MISRLKIANYKSIKSIELTFTQTNAFIGKNGVGKTTLMSAISILSRFSSGEDINSIANSVAPFGEFFNVNLDDKEASFEFDIMTRQKRIYTYRFSVSFGSRIANSSIKRYYINEESLHRKNTESGDRDLIFKRTASNGMMNAMNIQTKDSNEVPLRVTPFISILNVYASKEVKEVSDTISSYSIIWMDQSANTRGPVLISANNLDLSTIDGVAVSLFLKNREFYDKAMSSIKAIIPGFTPPIIRNIDQALLEQDDDGSDNKDENSVSNYLVYWKDSNYTKDINISQSSLSGGNSRVIYIILSLYNSESKSCFVAEEIENGMHFERISRLIEQIKMISKNQSIQLFFTTHNHLILNYLLPEEVIFTKLGDGGSIYERLTDTAEYEDIKNILNRDPSSTEMIDSGLLNIW